MKHDNINLTNQYNKGLTLVPNPTQNPPRIKPSGDTIGIPDVKPNLSSFNASGSISVT